VPARTSKRRPRDNDIKFDRISLEQGLSQSVVLSILQDSRGFMWFGTQDGLNRYDGYGFVVYKHNPEDPNTLSGDFIWSLHEDRSGALWIGTNGAGLNKLDLGTGRFTHYQHDPADSNSLSSDVVVSIHEDEDGMLWLGTLDGGLNRLDPQTGQFTHYAQDLSDLKDLGHYTIQSICEDHEGALWLGTSGGLSRFDRESGTFIRYAADPSDPYSLSHDDVQAVVEDETGNLWLGTNGGGLDRFERETERFIHYENDPSDPQSLSFNAIQSLFVDQEGTLWIGTNGGGLDRLERDTEQFIHYQHDASDATSLSSNQVWSIFQGPAGVLWLGTFGGGLNKIDPSRQKFTVYQNEPDTPSSLSDNLVWALYEDQDGDLWIGTNNGLNRLERDSGDYTHFFNDPTDEQSLSHNTVWSIHQDPNGVFWVGTAAGLDRLDLETQQFSHYPSAPVFAILQDQDDTIWIGTWGGGLGRLDPDAEKFAFYHPTSDPSSLSDDTVVSIHQDREGVLWMGTFNGGLNRYDRATDSFVSYANDPQDPQSLSHSTVLSIHEDQQGVLWVATGGGGLNRLDRETETFVHYRENDGLANDTVYGILEDKEGHLWLSTNHGISRFDPETTSFRNYDVGDGLQSNEFNQGSYHESRSGEMFFGGVNGFNAFYPQQIQDNPYIPPIVLTSLTQGGEAVELDQGTDGAAPVRLSWPNNFFEFDFAALSYEQPEKNQYAYMLEGFDDGWIEAGNRRFGRYTNLPGGSYTLRLKGSNNDGIWNEEGASLALTVVPPVWQRRWFQVTAALLLVTGIVVAYRLRVRSVEARSRELALQVAHRTEELAALNLVAAVVSRSLDLEEILNDALDQTLNVMGITSGGIYLLDERHAELTIVSHRGFGPDFVNEIDRLRLGEGFSGHVAQSGQPLVVRDVSADRRLTRAVAREEGIRSLVSVPLSSKGKVVGTLFIATLGYREFTDQEIELLTSIGHQIGVAVENARLFATEQKRVEQFRLMNQVGIHITSILDVDELLRQITRVIQETLGYHRVSIGLVEGDDVVFKAAVGPGWDELQNREMRVKIGTEGVTGRVASTGRPFLVPDASQEPRFLPTKIEPPSRSELAVPLQTQDATIGVLNVESLDLDAFDDSDLVVLQSLANQAAVAIEKARLLETERQRADELEALRSTMAEISAELDLPALLQAIVERAAGLLSATGGEFGLYDEDQEEIEIVASHSLGDAYVGTRHKVGEGAMGRVVETGQSLIIADYAMWPGGLAQYPDIHATLATPLTVGGRLIGVFTTVTTDPDRRFGAADLHLLDLFAQQAAIAIENARLYQQAKQLAVVEERQRLARDLHDSVTQALYGMTLYSEAATGQLELGHVDRVAEHLRELQSTAREALTEMRLLIYELRPPVLAEEGLAAALRDRLLAVEGRIGLKTDLQVEGEIHLPPGTEEELYRIAQEALNNALKHAKARSITVSLRQVGASVRLEVVDDGVGFDPVTVSNKGGVGLSAMAERAAELGATLTVDSRPGQGTQLQVEVSA
jgi:GAF domain-containing protein/ligand-binding sensor domain-containing protein/two-component sensor histidine kinase